jgi:hypothetical protein
MATDDWRRWTPLLQVGMVSTKTLQSLVDAVITPPGKMCHSDEWLTLLRHYYEQIPVHEVTTDQLVFEAVESSLPTASLITGLVFFVGAAILVSSLNK